MVVAGDGNISARMDDGSILCTPSGLCKGRMRPDQLIIVDETGAVLKGDLKPSSELKMHLMVYRQRPDVKAAVHAHPPVATGFACAGEPLTKALLSEVIITLGCIPIAPYGTPSTEQVAEGIRDLIKVHDGMLLANHGALTVGPDLMTAYYRMETIEHFARITLVTRILGKETLLTADKVQELQALLDAGGMTPPALSLGSCPVPASPSKNDPEGTITLTRDELISLIQEALMKR
jgi:L-fuculose-phosphate aldolase